MARILITDGEQRSALAATRSLGRADHEIFVAASTPTSLAGSSRYVRDTGVVPDPLRAPEEFAEMVIVLLKKWDVDLLMPVTEASLLAVLPRRDGISAFLPFPSAESFLRLCDKQVVANESAALGIRVPRTVELASPDDFDGLPSDVLTFPVVVKPHRSVTGKNGTWAKNEVFPAADRDTLTKRVRELPESSFPVLIQERITGPGVGIFVVLHRGELIASFAHRRIREKPPWGGVSVYRESIPLDPLLLRQSIDLLNKFDFEGAAMVEYKIDERTGESYIMEINGRFWGSLQLAIDAGVDFPKLLVDAVINGEKASRGDYRQGVRSRWFWGDVDNLLLNLRGRRNEDGVAPSRLRACFDFLRAFGPGSRSEVLQLSDPLPAWRETLDWFGSLGIGKGGR